MPDDQRPSSPTRRQAPRRTGAKRTTRRLATSAAAAAPQKKTAAPAKPEKPASAAQPARAPSKPKKEGNPGTSTARPSETGKTKAPSKPRKIPANDIPPGAEAAPKPEKPAKAAAAEPPKKPEPSKQESTAGEPPVYADMARFAQYMADINVKTRDILEDVVERRADIGRRAVQQPADPLNASAAGTEVATALSSNPLRMMQLQLGLWEDYTKLVSSTMERMAGTEPEPVAQVHPGDKRFVHKAWDENPLLDFVKQSYLLFGQWVDKAIQNAEGVDDSTKRRAFFHADQVIAAMSPSNNPALNPEVFDETLRTQGVNWLNGFKNFVDDLERGHGELAIRQADLDHFKVGENLATTPGKVVYQNALMQLIQYAPTTDTVAERPVVIFPPWINKFYILDLQPQNSFIRWLLDQGRTVFVVSWVNPGPELKEKSFPDYMREGVFEALEAVERAIGVREVDTIGYCIGGTLLAVTLAYMAQIRDERIKTATFFTAQTDFSDAGDLLLFVDDRQIANIEAQIDAAGGVLEGSAMARTFNMLRPNDLIWSAFVDNYYLGKEAKKFDLLHWNADSTRMTKACHLFYLRNFYQDNLLAKGEMEVDGQSLDLSKVNIPIFMQAGEKDHIAPCNSVYRSAKFFEGADVRYMLAGSGHIAGVINPPHRKKYHYRTNDRLPSTLEEWTADATYHDYSWWPYWIEWLGARSGGEVAARVPGAGGLEAIEDAPGSYVAVRSDE